MLTCMDCGTQEPRELDYMVKDEIWKAAHLQQREVCCLVCLYVRLRRLIRLEDLTDAAINDRFFRAGDIYDEDGEIIAL